jgi:hypothetical protein
VTFAEELADDVAARLVPDAPDRGTSAEDLAAQILSGLSAGAAPAERKLGVVGIGASGRGDISAGRGSPARRLRQVIIVDTGVLYAAVDTADSYHRPSAERQRAPPGPVVVSITVVVETSFPVEPCRATPGTTSRSSISQIPERSRHHRRPAAGQ